MTATQTKTKWTEKVLKWLKAGASEKESDLRFLDEMAAILDPYYLAEVERHKDEARSEPFNADGAYCSWGGPRSVTAMMNTGLMLFKRRDRASIAVANYEFLRLAAAADEMEETGELSHDLVSNPAIILAVMF